MATSKKDTTPGRKTHRTKTPVVAAERASQYVYTSEAMKGLIGIDHQPKRLEFRVDRNDRAKLSTRIDELIDAMADVHRVKREVFRNLSVRDHDLLFAQQVTWFILRNRWHLPYEVITAYFAHHRTTIRHGVENCESAYGTDANFRSFVDLLPFWANVDIEGGRAVALEAIFVPKVRKDTSEDVKTPPRARKGPNSGIVGEGR